MWQETFTLPTTDDSSREEPSLPEPVESPPLPSIEKKDGREKAEEICQLGDYDNILKAFNESKNESLLEDQIESLKRRYAGSRLREASKKLESCDWEMLTILELFDHATFEHCLRTYEGAHQKIRSPEPIGVHLRENIKKEGFVPWDVELACLLHDMGKISMVPKDQILNNTLRNNEWHELFESFCIEHLDPDDAQAKIGRYNMLLASHPTLREKDITPLFVALRKEECHMLDSLGIDTGSTLARVLEKHQDISGEIARRYYPESSIPDLVAHHHERRLTEENEASSQTSLNSKSVVLQTLRIADISDAFHRSRPYKGENATLTTLAFLIQKAAEGFIDDTLTYLWIDQELKKFDPKAYLHNLAKDGRSAFAKIERDSYETVMEYLSSFIPLES